MPTWLLVAIVSLKVGAYVWLLVELWRCAAAEDAAARALADRFKVGDRRG